MPQERSLDDRLSALERSLDTVTDHAEQGSPDAPTLDTDARTPEDRPDLDARIDTLEDRLSDLEAGLQAVRGYVGNVEHVNQSVERRANAAIAAVERLESTPTTPPVATAERSTTPESTATQDSSNPDEEPASADTHQPNLLERLLSAV